MHTRMANQGTNQIMLSPVCNPDRGELWEIAESLFYILTQLCFPSCLTEAASGCFRQTPSAAQGFQPQPFKQREWQKPTGNLCGRMSSTKCPCCMGHNDKRNQGYSCQVCYCWCSHGHPIKLLSRKYLERFFYEYRFGFDNYAEVFSKTICAYIFHSATRWLIDNCFTAVF